jgi:hypothetical protein
VSTPDRARFGVGAVVRNKALAAGAADWIDGLPELVAGLERDWRITVGRRYNGSTEAFVAQAILDDGTSAVLKLMIPRPGDHAVNEITVLRLIDGDGCPRLLRADPARGALLLERLGRPLVELGLPMRRRHEIRAREYAEAFGGTIAGLIEAADPGLLTSAGEHGSGFQGRTLRTSVGFARGTPPELDFEPARQSVTSHAEARFAMTLPPS